MSHLRRGVLVLHHSVFGGPHNQALRLDRILAERGWEFTVVIPADPGNALQRLREGEVTVRVMPLGRLRAVKSPRTQFAYLAGLRRDIRRLRSLLRELRPDVVVIGGLVNPQGAIAARLEGIPVVWQLLDTRAPWPVRTAMTSCVRRMSDAIMCTGRQVAELHFGGSIPSDRIVYFYPPVDCEKFAPDPRARQAARDELGLPQDALVIGTVGNLNPMKGHEVFVRAASELKPKRAEARFVILGAEYEHRPSFGRDLLAAARGRGLRPEVDLTILDPGDRVAELAAAFDIFWLTSEARSEGIPTAVGEAMALGIPVIASRVGAIEEAITSGTDGVLVNPGDPRMFVEHSLAMNREARARLGSAARSTATAKFALTTCAARHLEAFGLAVRRRRAGA